MSRLSLIRTPRLVRRIRLQLAFALKPARGSLCLPLQEKPSRAPENSVAMVLCTNSAPGQPGSGFTLISNSHWESCFSKVQIKKKTVFVLSANTFSAAVAGTGQLTSFTGGLTPVWRECGVKPVCIPWAAPAAPGALCRTIHKYHQSH